MRGRLAAQIVKEFLSYLRDPKSRLTLVGPPIVQLLVFSFAVTLDVSHVSVAVLNDDAGRWSTELVSRLEASSFVDRVRIVGSPADVAALVDAREALVGLHFPADFSRRVAAGQTAKVQVVIDGRRANAGQIALGYLNAIAAGLGAELATSEVATPSAAPTTARVGQATARVGQAAAPAAQTGSGSAQAESAQAGPTPAGLAQAGLAQAGPQAGTVEFAPQVEAGAGSPAGLLPRDVVSVRHWFNPNLIYRWFVVPSLSGILAMLISLIVTSLSIARERELGTFDQLLVSPAQPLEIIVGKTVPALIIGTLLGGFMISAGALVFRIPFTGSALWLLASLVLFILSMVGIGLMVSSVCRTQQQAILGTLSIGVPLVLISGFATPVENMPRWLQLVAEASPLKYYLIIVRGSFLKALPAADIFANAWPMALIALVTLSSAVVIVKRNLQ